MSGANSPFQGLLEDSEGVRRKVGVAHFPQGVGRLTKHFMIQVHSDSGEAIPDHIGEILFRVRDKEEAEILISLVPEWKGLQAVLMEPSHFRRSNPMSSRSELPLLTLPPWEGGKILVLKTPKPPKGKSRNLSYERIRTQLIHEVVKESERKLSEALLDARDRLGIEFKHTLQLRGEYMLGIDVHPEKRKLMFRAADGKEEEIDIYSEARDGFRNLTKYSRADSESFPHDKFWFGTFGSTPPRTFLFEAMQGAFVVTTKVEDQKDALELIRRFGDQVKDFTIYEPGVTNSIHSLLERIPGNSHQVVRITLNLPTNQHPTLSPERFIADWLSILHQTYNLNLFSISSPGLVPIQRR